MNCKCVATSANNSTVYAFSTAESDSKTNFVDMTILENDLTSDAFVVKEEELDTAEILPLTYDGNSTCRLLGATTHVSTSQGESFIDPFSFQHKHPERFTSSKVRWCKCNSFS